MTRQDLRNRAPKFKGLGAAHQAPYPKPRRSLKPTTVLKVVSVLVLLALLWETLPSECRTTRTEVPRYCVD